MVGTARSSGHQGRRLIVRSVTGEGCRQPAPPRPVEVLRPPRPPRLEFEEPTKPGESARHEIHGKSALNQLRGQVDSLRLLEDGIQLVKATATARFDESVDIVGPPRGQPAQGRSDGPRCDAPSLTGRASRCAWSSSPREMPLAPPTEAGADFVGGRRPDPEDPERRLGRSSTRPSPSAT